MDEPESPFARVPASSVTEPPGALTYEGQLAHVGELGHGLRSRPKGVRIAGRLIILLPLLAIVLFVIAMAVAVVAGLVSG